MKLRNHMILNNIILFVIASLYPACAGKKNKSSAVPVIEQHDDSYEGYMIRPFYPGKGYPFLSPFPANPDMSAIPYIDSQPDKVAESILEHTYVSHPWLRDRFRKILNSTPIEMLRLAQCTRLVVLDANADSSNAADGLVNLSAGMLVTNDAEYSTTAKSKRTPAPSDRKFFWAYLNSRVVPELDSAASDPEHRAVMNGMMQLTHEFIHNCDTKLAKTESVLNKQLSPYQAELPAAFFFWAQFGSESVKDTVEQHSFVEMGEQHMASAAADAYSDRGVNEQYAVLGEHMLAHKLLGVDYFEFFAEIPKAGEKFYDVKSLWGVRNKLCSPHVWAQAKIVIKTLGIFNDIDFPETPDCTPQVLPADISVMEAITSSVKGI